MPFPKIKFKKQQYNVASKSVFVLTVELLDSSVLECTLSAESTGRDCMDNICTRLGLQQPDLFGLRYVSRRVYPKIRWVDLDRPLKKQLEKYSREPYLYLGVIFYVTDVSLLEDEVTRYHYFLQLKMDVVEGRLRCNYEQAIVLASYSLQAEFGDHDPEKHTAEYLKDFPLLPKPMISHFEDRLGALTDAVITQHASLTGIAQQLAEIYYIVGAQQLEGYGQECFLAKDDSGNEVLVGASLIGICVRKGNGHAPQFFRWKDITNLVNHKKYFGIECQNFEFSVQFIFNEPEAAKYVWKMCVLQHTFFKMHQSATENCEMNITVEPSSPPTPTPLSSSPLPSLHLEEFIYHVPPGPAVIKPADIKNFQKQSQNIPLAVEKRAGHSSVSIGPERRSGYTPNRVQNNQTGSLNTTVNTTNTNIAPKLSVHAANTFEGRLPSNRFEGRLPSNRFEGRQPSNRFEGRLPNRLSNSSLNANESLAFSPPYISGARSTTDLDRLAEVPAYRPAPDYSTAVQGHNRLNQMAQLYSSHPEIRPSQQASSADIRSQHPDIRPQDARPSFPDIRPQDARPSYPDIRQTLPGQNILATDQTGVDFLFPLTNNHTYSTPELNKTGDGGEHGQFAVYKPPPPYPGYPLDPGHHQHQHHNNNFSNSTPDLASQTLVAGLVGGSSPDLVSRRTLGHAAGKPNNQANPDLHRTYDNLTSASSEEHFRYPAYSTEELNAVYNIAEREKSQMLQNIIKETYNPALQHNYLYDQQIDTKRLSVLSRENNILQEQLDQIDSKQLDQNQLAILSRQLEGQQLDQQQLATLSRQLEGQQLDQQQLGLFLRQIEGLQLDQQQIALLSRQLEGQKQLSLIARQQLEVQHLSGADLSEAGEEGAEPIYQNQGQILAQSQGGGATEPIYQNLPIHQKLNETGGEDAEIFIDETVEGVTTQGSIDIDHSPVKDSTSPCRESTSVPKEKATFSSKFNIRKALTLSREDLKAAFLSGSTSGENPPTEEREKSPKPVFSPGDTKVRSPSVENLGGGVGGVAPANEPRKRLEMRQYLEPAVENSIATLDKSLITSINNTPIIQENSAAKSKMGLAHSELSALNISSGTLKKKSLASISGTPEDHAKDGLQTRQKGRKRWGLTMAGKSGSLKSVKSDKSDGGSKSGEESRNSSGRGMGAMMLANLHGLTRSRPDLLSDTLPTPEFRAPTKIPKESIGPFLESKMMEGEVVREFEQIPKKKTLGCNTTIANLEENVDRNRFRDVVPYDENRVKINNEKDNKYGYINASHISATVGDSQRFYIAAQGPLPNTVHNFWSMVYACDVHLIVMLTDVSGSTKGSGCIPYWPQNSGSSIEIGEFTITKSFSSDSQTYTTTTLQLYHSTTRRKRRVWHVKYSDWSDQGLPRDVSTYLSFLEEISSIRRLSAGEIPAGNNKNPPVLVHCSAGVGRTGVTILSDILLYCLDHNIDIDIPKVLTHLRHQRMLMVQTLAQYKFVHTVLINYLRQSRLI